MFAKLFDTKHGQVLVEKPEEGYVLPALRVRTSAPCPLGATHVFRYTNERARDEAFYKFDQAEANRAAGTTEGDA